MNYVIHIFKVFLYLNRNHIQGENINVVFNSQLGRKLGVRSIRKEMRKLFPCHDKHDYCVGKNCYTISFLKEYVLLNMEKPSKEERKKIDSFYRKQAKHRGNAEEHKIYCDNLEDLSNEIDRIKQEMSQEAPKHGIKDVEAYNECLEAMLKSKESYTYEDKGREYNNRISLKGWEKKIIYKDCKNYDIKCCFPTILATLFNKEKLIYRNQTIVSSKYTHTIASMGALVQNHKLYKQHDIQNIVNIHNMNASEIKLFLTSTCKELNSTYKFNRIAAKKLVKAILNTKYFHNSKNRIFKKQLPNCAKEFVDAIKNQIANILNKQNDKCEATINGTILFYFYSQIESQFMNRIKEECKKCGIDYKLRCHDGCIVDKIIPQELIKKVKATSPMFKWIELIEKPF